MAPKLKYHFQSRKCKEVVAFSCAERKLWNGCAGKVTSLSKSRGHFLVQGKWKTPARGKSRKELVIGSKSREY